MLEDDDDGKDHSQFSPKIQNVMSVSWPTEIKGDNVWTGQHSY